MSSGASLKGDRTRTAYGVSKAGVKPLTMYVATSHGKKGIRVNTILPGLIITDAVRAHLDDKMVAGLGKAVLTPSVGQPDDIADVVVFLASDESRYITGQMIAVDGGMSAHVGLGGDGSTAPVALDHLTGGTIGVDVPGSRPADAGRHLHLALGVSLRRPAGFDRYRSAGGGGARTRASAEP